MSQNRWFKPGLMKRHSGFSKENSVTKNLAIMYEKANLKNPADRWLRVAKQSNVLSNITKDKTIKEISRAVATIAFKRAAKLRV